MSSPSRSTRPVTVSGVRSYDRNRSSKKIAPSQPSLKRTNGFSPPKRADTPKWQVAFEPSPSSRITNEELALARNKFFEIDRDGSGSIDREELGVMLRSLGQNPTESELEEMMNHAEGGDRGDGDGKISFREWLGWYAVSLRHQRDNNMDDMLDAFMALGGSSEKEAAVPKDEVFNMLKRDFGLNVDIDDVFDVLPTDSKLTIDSFKQLSGKEQPSQMHHRRSR